MNKCILIGRMVRDPELKFAAGSGTAVTKFSMAVNRQFKREGQPEADFINCIAFGKIGETIAQYLVKGREVAIEGHIQTGSYDAKDGTKRYTTDIIVDSFKFIGNNSSKQVEGQANNDIDMTPVNDDGDIPF